MNTKTIYLIRHGQINTLGEKRYIGILDIPLSSEGTAQANKLKEYFSRINIDKIYTSNLIRSVQTSRIIAENKDVQISELKELREINMGDWEGKTFKEIKKEYPEEFKKRIENVEDFRPTNGESFGQCRDRAVDIFNRIAAEDADNIIITAHAGINRVILASLLRIPMNDIFKFAQDYGCINKISFFNERDYRIEYINYTL